MRQCGRDPLESGNLHYTVSGIQISYGRGLSVEAARASCLMEVAERCSCCTCFVSHRDGTVAKGGGANLSGQRAVLSALTETPYPYPDGPPSTPAPADLPWLEFETLPDFSTGIPDQDLMRVEQTMLANRLVPIYVDITRKDLDIPVVKALVPGMEMMADFDQYSRISSRLFNNYLKIHK